MPVHIGKFAVRGLKPTLIRGYLCTVPRDSIRFDLLVLVGVAQFIRESSGCADYQIFVKVNVLEEIYLN